MTLCPTCGNALASSPEPARDRAERRVAELQAAGLHTLSDIERAQSSGERAGKPKTIGVIAHIDHSEHALTAAIAALSRPQADDGWRPTHRHVKRGSEYMLLGIGKMQTQGWLQELVLNGHVEARTSVDMREVAIYRGSDGSLWARPIEDFNDGRFEALPSAPATGGGE